MEAKKRDPDINMALSSKLETLSFSEKYIVKAIDNTNTNSACGPDEIPAVVVKKLQKQLSLHYSSPVMLKWMKPCVVLWFLRKIFFWKSKIIVGCTPILNLANDVGKKNFYTLLARRGYWIPCGKEIIFQFHFVNT